MSAEALAPGDAHPFPPLPADELAASFRVAPDEAAHWLDEGCPRQRDGRVDPFACHDWLLDGRLDRCPVLARRWRAWRRWFQPGPDAARARRVLWRRTHRLYLPRPLAVEWWLPVPQARAGQPAVVHRALSGAGVVATGDPDGFDRLAIPAGAAVVEVVGGEDVTLAPHRLLEPGHPEHAALRALVRDFAGTFRYRYRHHGPWEPADPARTRGTCLDGALAFAARLAAAGRGVRLISGVVADDVVANPHFWLEVDTTLGAVPVDPTVPAIARLVGAPWQDWLDDAVGFHDARRIALRSAALDAPGIAGIPGGGTVASTAGEAVAEVDGARRNAWRCMDWVCGECTASFDDRAGG